MQLLRSTVAGALAGTAQVLSLTSRVLEVTADALRPSPAAKSPAPEAVDTPTRGLADDPWAAAGGDSADDPWAPAATDVADDPWAGAAGDIDGAAPADRELTDAELGLVPDEAPVDDPAGIGSDVGPDEMSDADLGLVPQQPVTSGQPDPTPLLDDTPHLRSSDSHIEELGMQSASAVVAAVADLSTDELRLLTEYEIAHRNRKSVLRAIERALLPATG